MGNEPHPASNAGARRRMHHSLSTSRLLMVIDECFAFVMFFRSLKSLLDSRHSNFWLSVISITSRDPFKKEAEQKVSLCLQGTTEKSVGLLQPGVAFAARILNQLEPAPSTRTGASGSELPQIENLRYSRLQTKPALRYRSSHVVYAPDRTINEKSRSRSGKLNRRRRPDPMLRIVAVLCQPYPW